MKGFIRSTAILSTTEFLLIGVAFFRNKYLATTIGPYGFGVYGLLNSFVSIVTVVTGIWLTSGITKLIAEFNSVNNKDSLAKVFSSSIAITLLLSVFFTIGFIIARESAIQKFLSPDVLPSYFVLCSLSITAISLNTIFLAALQGLMEVKSVVIIRVAGALSDIVLVFILVNLYGLFGFFLSYLVSSTLITFMLWRSSQKYFQVSYTFRIFKDGVVKKLIAFGSASLIIGLISYIAQYILRILITENISIESVGILQAGMAIFGYMAIINRGSGYVFLPKMSAIMEKMQRITIINDYLRFTLLINIPISVVVLLFGDYLILILYNAKFAALNSILFLFVAAHILNSIIGAFQHSILGLGLLKNYSIISILGTILLVVMPLGFIHTWGLASVPSGYILSYIVGIILFYMYSAKVIGFRFSRDVLILILISIATFLGGVYLLHCSLIIRVAWTFISIGSVGLLVSKEEYQKLSTFIFTLIKKFGA